MVSIGLKRLFFDRIFNGSYWTWRKHPAIIVPTMLGAGLTTIGQAIITLALVLILTVLAAQNTLFDFLVTSRAQGILAGVQGPAFYSLIIPTVSFATLLLILALVLGGGFVLSSEYGTYLEAWRDDRASFRSVLENGSRRWKSMAWTLLVSTIITWGPFAIGLALVLASILGATSTQGLVAVIASSYIFFIGLIASLVLAIFTVYSFPSVILDQLSGFAAVRRSFGVASHNLGITVTYSVVRIIFQIISILIMLFAGFIGLPLTALAETVLSLLLTPVLHSTKTMIYYYAGPSVPEMRFALTSPIWNDILRRLPRAAASRVKTGLIESARFIANARNIPFHVASVFSFGIGIFLGYYVSNNGIKQFLLDVVGYEQGRINPAVGGLSPLIQPVLGVDIFLHNWLVSIGTALSGIGFGAPAFGTIIFNGFIIGVLAPLVPNLTMLLAALLPHGIIEIPSFLLAGSVGIKLGYAALKARIGTEPGSREYLASSLRQAVYVVVGLAPLFLLAGLIEADLTPIIMRMFGWTG